MKMTSSPLAATVIIAGSLVAACLAGACGGGPETGESASTPAVSAPEGNASTAASEVAQLLPAEGAVAGWSRTKEPQVYGPGNLWEYINGAAETYLAFGFQEAASAGYKNAVGLEVT
ncbi:MAG: hypothetical protein EHM13_06315, partial [Acidobacteria bacterium]